MTVTPEIRRLTAAYTTMLTTVTGRPWGDTDAPTDLAKPYGICRHIPGGNRFGDLARPQGMAVVVYQLTSVGDRAVQAEALADRAFEATFALNATGYVNAITATGITVVYRAADLDGGIETEGPLTNSIRRVALTVHAT